MTDNTERGYSKQAGAEGRLADNRKTMQRLYKQEGAERGGSPTIQKAKAKPTQNKKARRSNKYQQYRERKGRVYTKQEATDVGGSPTIERGRAEAIQDDRRQGGRIADTRERKYGGDTKREGTEGGRIADNTERKCRGDTKQEGAE